jgi:protease-4
MSVGRIILKILKTIWGVLDIIVDIIVLAFIALTLVLIVGASVKQPHVPDRAALVVNPQGALVEQISGDPAERAFNRLVGRPVRAQTRLHNVVTAIRTAESDSRIKALVIDPRRMAPAGLAELETIGGAIEAFKQSGKPVYAVLDSPGQSQYYLASLANRVFLNPRGAVTLTGFGVYREYFKDAIDKLAIDWNVFRVGKFKSYVEPFTRNSMSKAAQKADSALLDVLWGSYRESVAAARGISAQSIQDYVNDMPAKLAAVNGDAAKLAVKAGLVDKLATHDQIGAIIAAKAGVGTSSGRFRRIGFRGYLTATGALGHSSRDTHQQVAVIVAEGDILAGNQPPGRIGGRSLSRMIRKARVDRNVKAMVLRVDSPGGSAFASQLILRQIQLMEKAGKPVVVSMGNVAASGGYWISMAADRIYAHPTTITGSIGILGMFPTFEDSLAKLGIHNDGIGTTKLAGDFRPTRPLSPEAKKVFQLTIKHGYNRFVKMVSKTRHLPLDQVKKIAQGRVWSGKDAKRLGLIDDFGGLQDATRAAAQLAGIAKHYRVRYIKQPLSFGAQLLRAFSRRATLAFGTMGDADGWTPAKGLVSRMQRLVKRVGRLNDPNGMYAWCFCARPMER